MKNNQDQTVKKRGTLAKIFMAMLAMNAMSAQEKGTVNVNPAGGMVNYGGGEFYTRKHPIKSYAKQNREAQKRRNIAARSKH
jgi:hypothetical protein